MRLFDDANIYQTWAYEAVRHGEKNMSHVVLKRDGQVFAMAQMRIIRVPILKIGIAYMRWGPLWRLRSAGADLEIFQQIVRAIRNEYVFNRGLVLRIRPAIYSDESLPFFSLLKEEGFKLVTTESPGRTLLMNLTPSIESLRKGFDPKWRNHLNRAIRNGLNIIEGQDDGLFGEFIKIYEEMHARKRFALPNDINEFREIQKKLPEEAKMNIIICLSNGKPGAGAICSAIGNTGLTLFRATNEIGMESAGSYLVQWRILEWAKERNCLYYNLNGINPDKNPSTYRFKAGVCGRNGKDVYYIGQFNSYRNIYAAAGVRWAEKVRYCYKRATEIQKRLISSGHKKQD
jgi:lipid II:glycine glycyltransferase (peptidoglycan interpeptide bridge formation enzyme)